MANYHHRFIGSDERVRFNLMSKTSKPKKRKLPDYTSRGCPLTKNSSNWCFMLCEFEDGTGFCGRVAPHSVEGRTQRAIRLYKEKHERSECDFTV